MVDNLKVPNIGSLTKPSYLGWYQAGPGPCAISSATVETGRSICGCREPGQGYFLGTSGQVSHIASNQR